MVAQEELKLMISKEAQKKSHEKAQKMLTEICCPYCYSGCGSEKKYGGKKEVFLRCFECGREFLHVLPQGPFINYQQAGFTDIEIIICGVIFAAFLGILLGFCKNQEYLETNVSFGINGMTETRCINNYQFVIGEGGQARQILDEFGKGVKCERKEQ